MTAVLCIVGIFFGISAAMIITKNISGSINQLKLATEKISEGKFDDTPEVENEEMKETIEKLKHLDIQLEEKRRQVK